MSDVDHHFEAEADSYSDHRPAEHADAFNEVNQAYEREEDVQIDYRQESHHGYEEQHVEVHHHEYAADHGNEDHHEHSEGQGDVHHHEHAESHGDIHHHEHGSDHGDVHHLEQAESHGDVHHHEDRADHGEAHHHEHGSDHGDVHHHEHADTHGDEPHHHSGNNLEHEYQDTHRIYIAEANDHAEDIEIPEEYTQSREYQEYGRNYFIQECWPIITGYEQQKGLKWNDQPQAVRDAKLMKIRVLTDSNGASLQEHEIDWDAFERQTFAMMDAFAEHFPDRFTHGLNNTLAGFGFGLYRGTVDKDDATKAQGRGIWVAFGDDDEDLKESCCYIGDWRQGKREGYGVMKTHGGGYIYKGEWFNGKPQGKGQTYYSSNGMLKFAGFFNDGKKEGDGVEFNEDGKRLFEGTYEGNKRGAGTKYLPDGSIDHSESPVKRDETFTSPRKERISAAAPVAETKATGKNNKDACCAIF